MLDVVLKKAVNPLAAININLGTDKPLWMYVKQAVQELEILNVLRLYKTDPNIVTPFLYVGNWVWNPYPSSTEIQHRRRETGTKLLTKSIGNYRLGILEFDIYYGARDKNKNLETGVMHNKIYVPIEDDQGRYLIENVLYSEYQLVDKLLYPSGKDCFTLKSLLPIVVKYNEASETSIDGTIVTGKIGMVKIFTTMEPILACFMHIPAVLSYLGVFPALQFCDTISDDKDKFEYFQPIEGVDIYIKAYKKGLDTFLYIRSILVMAVNLIKKYSPPSIEEVRDPRWWVYQLSLNDNIIEHRGACHEMHVARMLDTISANILPVPEIDKRTMVYLLKYALQTEFTDVNIYSYENKRLRLNEVISTIVTADVSNKLKKLYRYGVLITTKEMQPSIKFGTDIILKQLYKLGTVHVTDFTNDMDYCQQLKFTRKGPNSLGNTDSHKITFNHRQLHPSALGLIDLIESPKDVGQTGMLSPWMDNDSPMFTSDVNKYPNIEYDLFEFMRREFNNRALMFDCDNVRDFKRILDKLVAAAYVNIDIKIPEAKDDDENDV